jgi:hypothetical protein
MGGYFSTAVTPITESDTTTIADISDNSNNLVDLSNNLAISDISGAEPDITEPVIAKPDDVLEPTTAEAEPAEAEPAEAEPAEAEVKVMPVEEQPEPINVSKKKAAKLKKRNKNQS